MTLLKCLHHIDKPANLYPTHFSQFTYIVGKICFFYIHCPIRTPCRYHSDLETAFTRLLVITKVIYRIICRANTLNMIMTHQTTGTELRLLKFLITLVIDFTRSLRAQLLGDAKGRFQFQMAPMVKWITKCIGDRLSPFLEFFPIIGVFPRTIPLVHSVRTHSPPFIMVSTQPQFRNTAKTMIVCHHFGNQMTMIINDWHFCRMIVKKFLRGYRLQQEILIHKLFHN